MKQIVNILFLFLLFSLAGCVREKLIQENLITITSVTADVYEMPVTKTHLEDGKTVVWDADDVIGVFSDVQDVEIYCNENMADGSASKNFVGNPVSGTKFYAFAPGDGSFRLNPDNRNQLLYTYEATSQAIGTNPMLRIPMVATLSSDIFKFKQTMGLIHFSIQGEHVIKYLRLRGNDSEPLAGHGTIDLTESSPVFVLDGTDVATELLCQPDEPYSIPADGKLDVYFPLPKMTFGDGITLDICYLDNGEEKVVSKETGRMVFVSRAIVRSFSVVDLDQLIEESAPINYIEPATVDLGIVCTREDGSTYKLLFAECNLGATKAEEFGCYYSWGETEPKNRFAWNNYKWSNGTDSTLTKYNLNPDLGQDGFTDAKVVLDPEDDAAHVNLGGSWRMPTKAEMDALLETKYNGGYEWEWKTINDISGWEIVNLATGNSIFLPEAGYKWNSYSSTSLGRYWTSTLFTDKMSYAYNVYFSSEYARGYGIDRYYGLPIRPVYDAGDFTPVSVTGITLDRASLSLVVGETYNLKATITPLEATNRDIRWSSTNWNIVEISSKGVLTAKAPGRVTITARTSDGDFTATCSIAVIRSRPSYSLPSGAVDLGLSVYWATCNLGATKPEGIGDFYAWGELEPYYEAGYSQSDSPVWKSGKEAGYAWGSYRFNPSGDGQTFTRYTGAEYSCLLKEDDAASVQLGGAWRMPTINELYDLMYGCVWTWQQDYQGTGINGYLVSANDNSIFLPAAGGWDKDGYSQDGTTGAYASSRLVVAEPENYRYLLFSPNSIGGWSYYRFAGISIRPVYGDRDEIPVAQVSLDKTRLVLYVGETGALTPTLMPGDATNKNVTWKSSDESVAKVSASGVVTAISAGRVTVSAITESGGLTVSCTVTVKTPNYAPAGTVDLGLSVYWATCNLGASSPEEYGDYYAWGETEPYYEAGQAQMASPTWKAGKEAGYAWASNKYNPSGDGKTFTRYQKSVGYMDLLSEDDAATFSLGDLWRMPTHEEYDELIEDCTWVWTTNYQGTGISGYVVSGNGNSIFLPAANARRGTDIWAGGSGIGQDGNYWSASRYYDTCGIALWIASGYNALQSIDRYWGYTIRPVRDN